MFPICLRGGKERLKEARQKKGDFGKSRTLRRAVIVLQNELRISIYMGTAHSKKCTLERVGEEGRGRKGRVVQNILAKWVAAA